jgi:DNA-binding NarL/FixJ family response regulator
MRVVVADDVMLVRSGLARLLSDAGVEVVGEAADADALLRLVALDQPDVAIVDIRMPPTHTDEGLVAARRIRERYPKTAVVLLSQYLEPRYAQRGLAVGPVAPLPERPPGRALHLRLPAAWLSRLPVAGDGGSSAAGGE